MQEPDLKNILPAQVPLSEMLKNTSLQKQWLSHLMDSKQIHEAQMLVPIPHVYLMDNILIRSNFTFQIRRILFCRFLNLLRSHLKETTKENVPASQKIGQKFVTNDNLITGRGLPPISQVISLPIVLCGASRSYKKF